MQTVSITLADNNRKVAGAIVAGLTLQIIRFCIRYKWLAKKRLQETDHRSIDLQIRRLNDLLSKDRKIEGRGNKIVSKNLGRDFSFEIDKIFHDNRPVMVMDNIVVLSRPLRSGPVVDGRHHTALNFKILNYIMRDNVRGFARSELIFLSCRMSEDGRGLLGDIVQMSRQQILRYAQSDDRIRCPDKTVDRLENLLHTLDLSFGMQAPEWSRSPQLGFAEKLARRNLQLELMGSYRPKTPHLRLVCPEL